MQSGLKPRVEGPLMVRGLGDGRPHETISGLHFLDPPTPPASTAVARSRHSFNHISLCNEVIYEPLGIHWAIL